MNAPMNAPMNDPMAAANRMFTEAMQRGDTDTALLITMVLCVEGTLFLGLPAIRFDDRRIFTMKYAARRKASRHVAVFLGSIHPVKGLRPAWPRSWDLPPRCPRRLRALLEGVGPVESVPARDLRVLYKTIRDSFPKRPVVPLFADAHPEALIAAAEAETRAGGPAEMVAHVRALVTGARVQRGSDDRLRATTQRVLLGPERHARLAEAVERSLSLQRPSTIVIPWGAMHAEPIWHFVLKPLGFQIDSIAYRHAASFTRDAPADVRLLASSLDQRVPSDQPRPLE